MRRYAWLTWNLVVLSLVSFLTDISSEMIIPLIPFFLVIDLGASAAVVGLVEGIAESLSSTLKVVSGALSDRIGGRKPFVVAGYTISTAAKGLFAFCTSWTQIAFLRGMERVGKGVRTAPRDAIISASKRTGISFGLHRAMDTAGAVIGILLAIALLPALGFRRIFILAVIPAGAAALLVLLVRETDRRGRWGRGRIPGHLHPFLGVTALYAIANVPVAFMLLRSAGTTLPLPGGGVLAALGLYLTFIVVYALSSVPGGAAADRWGKGRVLILGFLLLSMVQASFTVSAPSLYYVLPFALFGVHKGLTDGVMRALVADLAPREVKATSLGAYHTTYGLSVLPGSIIAGLLWTSISPEATFAFGAGMSILAALTLIHLLRHLPSSAGSGL